MCSHCPKGLRTLLLVALLWVLGIPSARAGNVLGGRLLDLREQAVHVTAGFPDIDIGYHMPMSKTLELIPRFRFAYGRDLDTAVKFLQFGTGGRMQLHRKGKFSLALLFEGSAILVVDPDTRFGLALGWPGVAGTFRVKKGIDLDFGLQLQDNFLFGTPFIFNLYIAIFVGMEVEFSENVNGLVRFELGPDIGMAKGGSNTEFNFRAVMGVAYSF